MCFLYDGARSFGSFDGRAGAGVVRRYVLRELSVA